MTALAHAPSTTFRPPADLTADAPPEARGLARDGVRLLVAGHDGIRHTSFRHIGEHLRAGDALVVNDSATEAREIDAVLGGRGAVVLHVATPLDDGSWVVELPSAPDAGRAVLDAHVGDEVVLDVPADSRDHEGNPDHAHAGRGGLRLRLEGAYPEEGSSPTGVGNRLWRASEVASEVAGRRSNGGLVAHLRRHGRPIAYGYLRRRYPLSDYQTVFATTPGSAEMASAARPFTPELVTSLVAHGVLVAPVTLHTGLSSQEAGESPQPERFTVSPAAAHTVNAVRARGGRVVAVGTTATRALESAASVDGVVHPAQGWTDLVISPERPARVVRGLVTGWHDPEASHLLLVESVAGPALTQRAYDEASAHAYAWHEFGDSGLFLP